MSASTVHFLASYYNLTLHTYQKRNYMLEVNPNYRDGSFKDKLNVIDARWIDTETGLFIDITAVRSKKGVKGVVASKDKHEEKVYSSTFPSAPFVLESVAEYKSSRFGTFSPSVKASSKDCQSRCRTIMSSY